MNYCAIIGDIVNSKKIINRQDAQDQFKDALREVNQKYDSFIASNFTLTLGDEFQGLLYTPSIALEIISFIKEKMSPIELVFGIGIGQMLTSFSKESSVGSDGPAYWYARRMVEKAKEKKPSIQIHSNSPEDELLNSLFLFIEVCTLSQTERQKEMIELYTKLGSQKKVADQLGVNQSVVSVALQSAYYKEIADSYKTITHFLQTKWENR